MTSYEASRCGLDGARFAVRRAANLVRILCPVAQLYRARQHRGARPGFAHRHRRTHVFRPGGLCRDRRIYDRRAHNPIWGVTLADAAGRVHADFFHFTISRLHHAASVWALPSARHDRLGNCNLLYLWKSGILGQVFRYRRDSTVVGVWLATERRAHFLFLVLGVDPAGIVWHAHPTRLALWPRHPRVTEPCHNG